MANHQRDVGKQSRVADRSRFRSLLIPAGVAFALIAGASQQVHLISKLSPGETVRYQVQINTTTSSKTTTPIIDPGGATQASQSISLLVRLDVLRADPADKKAQAVAVRIRATYEKSLASSHADAFDPAVPSPDDSYNRLEGHSIEFTIEPGGAITDFKGLEDIFPNRSEADPIISWAKGLSSGAGAPGKGIVIGQKWSSESPLEGAPLSNLIWRSESTFLRNEPCVSFSPANAAQATSPHAPEPCAVILTSFKILRHGSAHSDATPPDYARNGLRTSGVWQGSGENLDSISLATGLIVRSTQTTTQDVDYIITSASTGSSIHQVSHSTTQSEITLVPQSQPSARP
jgi:hypothetical protein